MALAPLNDTPNRDIAFHRGAPRAFAIQFRQGAGGVLRAISSTIKMTITYSGGTIELTVGDGITLSTTETIANALATFQLTVAQSRLIPLGNRATYEIQETINGVEQAVMYGRAIGRGGDNSDV